MAAIPFQNCRSTKKNLFRLRSIARFEKKIPLTSCADEPLSVARERQSESERETEREREKEWGKETEKDVYRVRLYVAVSRITSRTRE